MRRELFAVLTLALVAGFVPSPSFAQAAPQSAPQGQQGGGGRANQDAPPQSIDLATAKRMIGAAEAAAIVLKDHVAICVMDVRGDMVFFQRMDTLDMIPSNTAQGKARAALVLGVPTVQLADAVSGGKPISVTVKRNMPAGEMTFMRGGLPIMRDGKMIGSIGVGGSATENDEKFAQVATDAMTAK